jgi:hypothetical protein
MGYRAVSKLTLEALDISGQTAVRLRGFPSDRTVGELVTTAVDRMGLKHQDPEGRPYVYHARHESSGQALHVSETVGDVLKNGDRIRLAPNIDAGRA